MLTIGIWIEGEEKGVNGKGSGWFESLYLDAFLKGWRDRIYGGFVGVWVVRYPSKPVWRVNGFTYGGL